MDNLLVDTRALFVQGIGHIDQYGTYAKQPWEYGIPYFLRDSLVLQQTRGPVDPTLQARIDALNSDIAVYEARCR